jgi:hypothetical protein
VIVSVRDLIQAVFGKTVDTLGRVRGVEERGTMSSGPIGRELLSIRVSYGLPCRQGEEPKASDTCPARGEANKASGFGGFRPKAPEANRVRSAYRSSRDRHMLPLHYMHSQMRRESALIPHTFLSVYIPRSTRTGEHAS